jgi:hypothetical protein
MFLIVAYNVGGAGGFSFSLDIEVSCITSTVPHVKKSFLSQSDLPTVPIFIHLNLLLDSDAINPDPQRFVETSLVVSFS